MNANYSTNGSSLEDCFTNTFALADLSDIKWRGFKINIDLVTCNQSLNDTFECPIISSYIKCLNKEILCVWRRVVINNVTSKDTNSKHYTKQLWCFWFNCEPDWKLLIHKDLTICETGDWEHGLSYECRTLLFKAYHNLIEQSLISIGFCRLGKYFVYPIENRQNSNNKSNNINSNDNLSQFSKSLQNTILAIANTNKLACSFNFFIHGESTVCCIIDIRQKSPVYKINTTHLTNVYHNQQKIDVILSPFGLSASITGNSFKETDVQVQKLISDWKKFFPIQNAKEKQNKMSSFISTTPFHLETFEDSFLSINNNNSNATNDVMPAMIEVIIGGIKMKYPSCFVFMLEPNDNINKASIQDTDAKELIKNPEAISSNDKNLDLFNETVYKDYQTVEKSFKLSSISPIQPHLPTLSFCIRNNVNQELNCSPITELEGEDVNQANLKWDIYDISCKIGCHCFRCRPKKSNKDNSKLNNQLSKKIDKNNEKENKQVCLFKSNIPFHRRVFLLNNPFDLESSKNFLEINESVSNDKNTSALANNTSINVNLQNLNAKNSNQLFKNTNNGSTLKNNLMDTSESPKSEIVKDSDKKFNQVENSNKTTEQNSKEKNLNSFEEMFSPYSGDKSNTNSPNISSVQWTLQPFTNPNKLKNGVDDKKTFIDSKDTIVVSNTAKNYFKNQFRSSIIGAIKRPLLPAESHLNVNKNVSKGLLYDFECVNHLNLNWDVPPPKNQRLVRGLSNENTNHFNDQNSKTSDFSNNSNDFDNSNKNTKSLNINDKNDDYESFLSKEDLNKVMASEKINKQNDGKENTLLNKVLTREEDIIVSYNDLDQIFDSGDESNDMFSVPGAPMYNLNRLHNDENYTKFNGKSSSCNNTNSILGVAELARMFPTPPSLEPNAAPSPYSNLLNNDLNIIEDFSKEKVDNYALSPIGVDNSKESTNVYNIPLQTKFISSSKYSPIASISLTNLKIPDECKYKSKKQVKSTTLNTLHKSNNLSLLPPPPPPPQKNSNKMTKNSNGYTHMESFNNLSNSSNIINSQNNFNSPSHSINVNKSNFGQNYNLTNNSNLYQNNLNTVHVNPNKFQQQNMNSNNSLFFNQNFSNSSSSKMIEQQSQSLSTSNYNVMKKEPLSLKNNQFNNNLPEINSLIVNLVLSDSMLNIYKDHNFDSCPLCICNMNIKGSDIDIYLPDNLMPNDEPQYKCTCGFSALKNRYLSSYSGLFFEDEFEITNVCYDPLERLKKRSLYNIDMTLEAYDKKQENVNNIIIDKLDSKLLELLKYQCSTIFSSSCLLSKSIYFEIFKKRVVENSIDETNMPVLLNSKKIISKRIFIQKSNPLFRSDFCEIAFLALMLGKQGLEGFPNKTILQQYNQIEDVKKRKQDCVHEWIFENGCVQANNHEVVQFLKNMQALLQDTLQRKLKDLGGTYNVNGPLTWRQLYKLAGRSEDQSEPQPIPSLLVAHDRDWVALSPFALKYWKECSLEPYSFTRDIGYVVICPDTDHILNGVKSFFKDLSAVYQMLKLGKHKPINKFSKDGVIQVGRSSKDLNNEVTVDEWFNKIGNGKVASKLKLYAKVCKNYASEYLKTLNLDKSIFDQNSVNKSSSENGNPFFQQTNLNKSSVASPLVSDSVNGIDKINEDMNQEMGNSSNSANTNAHDNSDADDDIRQPHIVIYIVEPFTFTNLDEDTYRLSCIGLLKCYLQIIESLPENLKNNTNLQIISLDSILQCGKDSLHSTRNDQFKSLAFSVFNQCRKVLVHQSISKSLTGFGPAASLEGFLKSKDSNISNVSKVYMPPFILAPLKDKQTELGEMFGDRKEKSQTLFASYCLTEDQKFITVACCNEKGDLIENSLINIEIPSRTKHKKASVIKFALQKLMDFLISVMSESTQPWRLVLGKIGRVGHGELKEWANFLSKKSLLKYSKQLKEKCKQCSFLSNYEMPSILSACLTSLEPDTNLRVFADQFTGENDTTNTCHLSTPEEASTTHILVFPTSSTTQSSQGNFPIDPLGNSLAEDDMLGVLDVGEDDLAVDDIFNWGSPGSPGRDQVNQLDSPGSRNNAFDGGNLRNMENDMHEEQCQLLQQPLSLGYYVSTAKTGKLPKWFWTTCSHLEECNPAFLKSALLIHTPSVHQINDDLYSNTKSSHPLDSNLTTDVLRYVLESYNSLSWLVLDPSTHDRMSCLPIHIQMLMQLYHTVQALF